jgi:ankyrin repeat protein
MIATALAAIANPHGVLSAPKPSGGDALIVSASIHNVSVGKNTMTVVVTNSSHLPVIGAKVIATVNMTNMDMGEKVVHFPDRGSGRYQGAVTFTMDGPWRVVVRASVPKGHLQSAASFGYIVAPVSLTRRVKAGIHSKLSQEKASSALLAIWKSKDGAVNSDIGSKVTISELKALYANGANVNARDVHGLTSIMMAAEVGNLNCVKYLASQGADVQAQETSGWTALHFASNADKPDCVMYLVSVGADVNKQNYVGGTALLYAAEAGDVSCATFLIRSKANVNIKDNDGMTPLMESAYLGDLSCTKLFIDRGAEINAKDNHGWTALMQAAAANKPDCVKLLLAGGADESVRSVDGDTAQSAAAKFPDVLQLLGAFKQ